MHSDPEQTMSGRGGSRRPKDQLPSLWARAAQCLASLALVWGGGAHAHGIYTHEGFAFPVGIDLGVGFGGGLDTGFIAGIEASAVYMTSSMYWAGLVVAGRHDTGRGDYGLAVGPELGFLIFGAEALVEYRDGEYGGRFRLVIPVVTFAPYFGLATAGENRWEAGLLLKWPFGLK